MARFLLVASLAFLPALSWGQDISYERFVPFSPGDRWEYQTTTVYQDERSDDNQPTTSTSFFVVRVDRDTTIAEQRWAIYEVGRYGADRALAERAACVGRYGRGDRDLTEFEGLSNPSGCSFDLSGYFFAEHNQDVTVEIGGSPYAVDETETWVSHGSGSGGTTFSSRAVHAPDIGLVRYVYQLTRRLSPRYSTSTTTELLYASVGGAAYGARAVDAAEAPAAPRRLAATAFPNPARSGRLRLNVEGAASGPVAVDVVDVLGRSIWSGVEAVSTGSFDLPAAAWPPGVYVVRVRDAEQATTTVRVTRL